MAWCGQDSSDVKSNSPPGQHAVQKVIQPLMQEQNGSPSLKHLVMKYDSVFHYPYFPRWVVARKVYSPLQQLYDHV